MSDELQEATRYAEKLACVMHDKHYPEVTQWRPLSGDLIGLLLQIDNMTSCLVREQVPKRGTQS